MVNYITAILIGNVAHPLNESKYLIMAHLYINVGMRQPDR